MGQAYLLWAFVISLAVIIYMITTKKFNPSFCLFVGAIVAAFIGRVPVSTIAKTLNSKFGAILTSTGILMLFAFVLCQYLNESGGIQEFAKALVRLTGKKYDLVAIAFVGYILSIPVGFLASVAIVAPMFAPMSRLTKRPVPAYLCAFIVPSLLSACTVVPTSGPVVIAGLLGIDIGWYMIWGIVITLIPAVISTLIAYYISNVYTRNHAGIIDDGGAEIDLSPDPTKPKAGLILALILVPIILIMLGAFAPYIMSTDSSLYGFLVFIGDTGISMFISSILCMITLRKYLPRPSLEVFNAGVKESGPILVMLGCAMCYGGVLTVSGVGDYIVSLLSNTALPVLLIALILEVAIHAGTGAGTVAAATTIPLLIPMFQSTGTSLMLFGLLMGIGQLVILIPTDVTFWFIKDACNVSIKDTALCMCVPATICGMVAFIMILIMNGMVLPGI